MSDWQMLLICYELSGVLFLAWIGWYQKPRYSAFEAWWEPALVVLTWPIGLGYIVLRLLEIIEE